MKLGPETKHNKTNIAKSKKFNNDEMISFYAIIFNFLVSTRFADPYLPYSGRIHYKSLSYKFSNL